MANKYNTYAEAIKNRKRDELTILIKNRTLFKNIKIKKSNYSLDENIDERKTAPKEKKE